MRALKTCACCQDLGFFPLWDREMIERPRQHSCDSIELFRRDSEFPMRLLETEVSASGTRGRKLERTARGRGHPQRAHEFEAWEPIELLCVPLAKRGIA